jgi:hypothetical protein
MIKKDVTSELLQQWIKTMDNGCYQNARDIAECKLVWFFGSDEALDRYLELYDYGVKLGKECDI